MHFFWRRRFLSAAAFLVPDLGGIVLAPPNLGPATPTPSSANSAARWSSSAAATRRTVRAWPKWRRCSSRYARAEVGRHPRWRPEQPSRHPSHRGDALDRALSTKAVPPRRRRFRARRPPAAAALDQALGGGQANSGPLPRPAPCRGARPGRRLAVVAGPRQRSRRPVARLIDISLITMVAGEQYVREPQRCIA